MDGIIKTKYGHCGYGIENDYAHVYNLYVLPEHRNKGKARRLINMAVDKIKKTGYQNKIQIVANSSDKNVNIKRLKNFYKSMGLEVFEYYG